MIRLNLLFYFLFIILTVNAQLTTLQKAYVALKNNDTTTAILYLDEYSDTLFNDIVIITKYKIYKEQKDYKKALNVLLSSKNFNPQFYLEISRLYASLNNNDSALFFLKKYMQECKSKLPEYEIIKQPEFLNLKNTKEWVELWQTDWYSEREKTFNEINYLLSNKKFFEALELVNEKLNNKTLDNDYLLLKAKILINLHNYEDAIKILQKILNIEKNNKKAINTIIEAYLAIKDYKKVIHYTELLYKIEPWQINHLEKIIKYFFEINHYKEAIDYGKKYLKLDTLNPMIYYILGESYYRSSNYNEAIINLKKVISYNPGLKEAYFTLGKCYLEQKYYEKAYYNFSMAMDLDPFNGEYFFYRAHANLKLNRTSSACSDFKKALQFGVHQAKNYINKYCK